MENSEVPEFRNASVHDPSVIKVDDTYYVIGSHLAMAKTNDFMKWDKVADGVNSRNPLFEDVTTELAEALGWARSSTLWAGDIVQLPDGKFYMYYNACEGSSPRSALGVAVADHIEGPYKNAGIFLKSGMWGQPSEDGTIYDATVHPNTIDPHTFFDAEGKLWMVYGSYSGGIFILEMDPETGFPLEAQGYGTHLMGGNHSRIEGPYIQYVPETGYYYLHVTFGGLDATGGYNMRVARSKNPDGPYVDAQGNDMSEVRGAHGTLFDDKSIEPYGVKLMGNYLFTRSVGEPGTGIGTGYVSPGHNSVYYNQETDEQLLIFHTRFPERGEQHEIRVHQLFMNEDGWPVAAPYRYANEKLESLTQTDIIGDYKYINHGKEITAEIKRSTIITLNEDGTISGPVNGTWTLANENQATLSINGEVYKGIFLRQWNPTTESKSIVFTALSNEGVAVWGSQTPDRTDAEIVEDVKNELDLTSTSQIISDLTLPTEGARQTQITWRSSNPEIVSNEGVVTRPLAGTNNAIVILTATITKGEATATKDFTIIVLAEKENRLVAHYPFDSDLNDYTKNVGAGTITGDRIDNTGGNISFADGGVHGQAAYFDGTSGIRLPNGLIASNNYTVSFWLNPEELTTFTTTFFGARTSESWVSFVPRGPVGDQTMVWSGTAWYDATTGMQVPTNKWTHIAFTVDDGKIDVYLDGVKKFSNTGFPKVFTNTESVFGLAVNYWDTPFKGLMDELLIYDGIVLSESEINEYIATGKIPQAKEPNLEDIKKLINVATDNHGIKNSLLIQLRNAESEFDCMKKFLEEGKVKQANHAEDNGYKTLRHVKDRIQQHTGKHIDGEKTNELIILLENLIDNRTITNH
ncbi:family 43 glycosylhydrolase [Pseudogracilibacillus auburnensis]|uniref:family 43 glycosylhydrolase n=1 Tax=Pseudogracilibacillus auburnensis TaxID=1494959 RepID=UPI0027DA8B3E|nr:family 43 glycosylhydrolase [Pseudogracilibacillus auburnensis]